MQTLFDELYLALSGHAVVCPDVSRDQWAEDVVQDVFSISGKTATGFPRTIHAVQVPAEGCLQPGDQLRIWKHKRDTEYRSWYGSQIDRMVFDYYDPDRESILAKIYDESAAVSVALLTSSAKLRIKNPVAPDC